MSIEKNDDVVPKRVWQPRFGLATLLMIMLVFCIMAAAGNYALRALREGTSVVAFFVVFTLVAPIVLLLLVSGISQALRWVKRNSKRW